MFVYSGDVGSLMRGARKFQMGQPKDRDYLGVWMEAAMCVVMQRGIVCALGSRSINITYSIIFSVPTRRMMVLAKDPKSLFLLGDRMEVLVSPSGACKPGTLACNQRVERHRQPKSKSRVACKAGGLIHSRSWFRVLALGMIRLPSEQSIKDGTCSPPVDMGCSSTV